MRVAVVILNWNGKSFLTKFLPSVVEYSTEATVYVADNASSDGSVEFVKGNFPSVQIIETGANLGFAGGYNKALQDLNEELFILLNSDVEVTENWLKPIITLFTSDNKTAACQPKILSYDHPEQFEYAGASGGYIDKYGYPFCRGRIFNGLETDNGQYDDATEVFWATGACLAVRSDVYQVLGGLDIDFFAHMEEIDLCWRIKRKGFKVMVEPESVVYHVGGGTLSKSNPRKTFLNFRNGLELMVKNLPKNELIPKIILRLILDALAALKFLADGQARDFLAVIRAHFAFYQRLKLTFSKRTGEYPKKIGLYQGSIVLDYFVRRKKKFTELSAEKFEAPE